MSLYTCSLSNNDPILRGYNENTQKLIVNARALVLNALEDKMKQGKYPEHMRGQTGVSVLTPEARKTLTERVCAEFAKCALAHSRAAGWHSMDDISALARPAVNSDEGVQSFVTNAVSAILTPVFPAVQSNIFDMLSEIRYGNIGDTFDFDIPSNEVFTWSAGARGVLSSGHDLRESNTIKLNPEQVKTTYDIPWIRIARGDYDFGGDLLAAALGWASYALGVFVSALADGAAKLTGSRYHAPTFTHDNFIRVKSAVNTANGNRGQVFCFGKEVALSKVVPPTEMLWGISEEWVKMGYLSQYARTPLIEIQNAFVPGTYASLNPVDVMDDDKLYFFAASADKPIKMAIAGDVVTVTKDQNQKSNRVTSYTLTTEMAIDVITGRRWGVMEGVI